MKRLYITNSLALLSIVAMTPPDIDRGLNASLAHEDAQQGKQPAAGVTSSLQTGTASHGRGLQASLAALGAESVGDIPSIGLTGKVTLVTKRDTEGLLAIDAFSGRVVPGQTDAPEWADELGLFCAVLGERHIYYSARLGTSYTPEMRQPEALAFEDLDWLAINPNDGSEQVIEADSEHRMDVCAAALGIDRSADKEDGHVADFKVETDISYDNTRTGEEMASFTEAQGKHFEDVSKTGTDKG